jgi:UDP-N-acetylglucosamine 2-epimerase (non-hydrolysing)
MINIDLIVGARPNFVKAAALVDAAAKHPEINIRLIHTGQHFDAMSDPFFQEFSLPASLVLNGCEHPHTDLPGVRLSYMIESLCSHWAYVKMDEDSERPNYAMVVGDTDSTLAGAIAAVKSKIPLIHVEAGLRSGNWGMQEEINRVLVDSVSDILYAPSWYARERLISENHHGRIVAVGNVMVDTLRKYLPIARERYIAPGRSYAVLTLHRAENVDDPNTLSRILGAVNEIGKEIPVIFPVHPRVYPNALAAAWNIDKVGPMGYLEFIALISRATFVMTDSGGVQEETAALGIPCLTLREETERPETVYMGINTIVGTDPEAIRNVASFYLGGGSRATISAPELWDGHAADRIMEDLLNVR